MIDARGTVITEGLITAKLRNNTVLGFHKVTDQVHWKDGHLLVTVNLPQAMIVHIAAEMKKKTPVPLSEIIKFNDESPLAQALIMGAYPSKKGTKLTLKSEMIDVEDILIT